MSGHNCSMGLHSIHQDKDKKELIFQIYLKSQFFYFCLTKKFQNEECPGTLSGTEAIMKKLI